MECAYQYSLDCDITSHSEFMDLLFNIIPIYPVDAPW